MSPAIFTKQCSKCKRILYSDRFSTDSRWGLRSNCKDCDTKYRDANRPAIRSKARQYAASMRSGRRAAAIEALGGAVCVRCGFTDIRALQIDHIHGGGDAERRTKGYAKIYKTILTDSKMARKKYQVLCANCNWIKRAEAREAAVGPDTRITTGEGDSGC